MGGGKIASYDLVRLEIITNKVVTGAWGDYYQARTLLRNHSRGLGLVSISPLPASPRSLLLVLIVYHDKPCAMLKEAPGTKYSKSPVVLMLARLFGKMTQYTKPSRSHSKYRKPLCAPVKTIGV